MLAGVVVVFGTGVAGLFVVPFGRPSGWRPNHGTVVYALHSVLSAALAVAAALLLTGRPRDRIVRLGAIIGASGLGAGALGGTLAVSHPWRLTGCALMLAGSATAGFGYLLPLLDASGASPDRPG